MSVRILALAALSGALAAAVSTAGAPANQCAASQHPGRGCSHPRPGRAAAARRRGRARSAPASLGVREHEFRIGLSRLSVAAGRVIVELDNEGQDGHDLRVAPNGSERPVLSFDELRSGTRATKTIMLRPGTYRLWCSLPGHEAAGMRAVLRVE
jgi:plastocyanin